MIITVAPLLNIREFIEKYMQEVRNVDKTTSSDKIGHCHPLLYLPVLVLVLVENRHSVKVVGDQILRHIYSHYYLFWEHQLRHAAGNQPHENSTTGMKFDEMYRLTARTRETDNSNECIAGGGGRWRRWGLKLHGCYALLTTI